VPDWNSAGEDVMAAANGTQAIDRAAELLSLVVLSDEPQAHADLVARTGGRVERVAPSGDA